VDEPHAPQARPPGALTPEVREEETLVIAHDDVLNAAAPVDYHADLPPQLDRNLREEGRELERDDLGGRHLAPVDPLERVPLSGLQTDEMS